MKTKKLSDQRGYPLPKAPEDQAQNISLSSTIQSKEETQ
jgi:hypothetical protein